MADDVDTLVAELQEVVDVTPTAALRLLNRRHRELCAYGRTYRAAVDFGLTVANDLSYAFPATPAVVELLEVTVGGAPFGKARRRDWYSYSEGTLTWTGPTGLWFAEEDSELILTPAPSTAGLSIMGLAVAMPPDLLAGGAATTIKCDGDFLDALVDGAAATELLRIGEGDPAAMEAKFTAAKEEQRRRVQRKFHGPGPAQIRIQGVNA